MENITITIDSKANARLLKKMLAALSFVKSIRHNTAVLSNDIPKSKFKSESDFLELCGIWEGRDITLNKIRDKAWRKIIL